MTITEEDALIILETFLTVIYGKETELNKDQWHLIDKITKEFPWMEDKEWLWPLYDLHP